MNHNSGNLPAGEDKIDGKTSASLLLDSLLLWNCMISFSVQNQSKFIYLITILIIKSTRRSEAVMVKKRLESCIVRILTRGIPICSEKSIFR